ncbi:MAG: hypothetical protein ACKVP7_06475 [Hyphomicrobiaceae bacterium]
MSRSPSRRHSRAHSWQACLSVLIVAAIASLLPSAAGAGDSGTARAAKAPRAAAAQKTAKAGAPENDIRPPQFVVLAFDGSQSHEMWRQTIDLAKTLSDAGKPARFTYFISGVYFLAEKHRRIYDAPGRGPGRSAIGWGSSKDDDIPQRIARVNEAHAAGHEIASHANGHFDGGTWSEAQWKAEFGQFNRLLFDAAKNNGLAPDAGGTVPALAMEKRSIVGFRAPQLGISKGLWPVLEGHGFRYDTSRSSRPDYWPKKLPQSGWNFPLAELKIPGTAARALSMDYNFYYAQSGAKPYPTKSALFEQQMYEAYIQYFNGNYLGNRAPLHIGHHFSQWNGGAYWRAFQRFATTVCGKPEVKCVTYRELADYLDAQKPELIETWQKSRFPKLAAAEPIKTTLGRPLDIRLTLAKPGRDGRLALVATGRDWAPKDYTVTFEINGEPADAKKPTLRALRAALPVSANITIGWRVMKGDIEVARLTHTIDKLGSKAERISAEPLELAALRGEPASAHEENPHDHEHF